VEEEEQDSQLHVMKGIKKTVEEAYEGEVVVKRGL